MHVAWASSWSPVAVNIRPLTSKVFPDISVPGRRETYVKRVGGYLKEVNICGLFVALSWAQSAGVAQSFALISRISQLRRRSDWQPRHFNRDLLHHWLRSRRSASSSERLKEMVAPRSRRRIASLRPLLPVSKRCNHERHGNLINLLGGETMKGLRTSARRKFCDFWACLRLRVTPTLGCDSPMACLRSQPIGQWWLPFLHMSPSRKRICWKA